MRVVAISMVKNEADIVEPFVRHNLAYVDRMYVFEHHSVDETRAHLDALRAEGLPVELVAPERLLATGAKLQAKIMSQLLRQVHAREGDALYLFLDADEFLHHPEGAAGLRDACARLPHLGVGRLPWRTHVIPPDAHDSYLADPPLTFRMVRRVEEPPAFKAALRLAGGLPPLRLAEGNHEVLHDAGEALAMHDLPGVSLHHVPVRSAAQVLQKAVLGWLGTLRGNPDARRHGLSFHQQEIFDLVCERGALDGAALHRLSCGYAQNAVCTDWIEADTGALFRYRRRFGPPSISGLALVLRELERQAGQPRPTLSRAVEKVELYSLRYAFLRPVARALNR